jgi:phosphate transport system permease protein
VHLERSFMHLGFHICDVGFQSRNSEAGKPMVFVTTILLITLVAVMNAVAIIIRNRLKKRFVGSQF